MYEWLIEEVQRVRWRKFFSFKQDAVVDEIVTLEQRFGPLPADYVQFIRQFGYSLLFRDLYSDSYNMAIFSKPRVLEGRNGELLLEIGFFINGGYAHFRKPPTAERVDPGVYEGASLRVCKRADSFGEWVKMRFMRAKKLYKVSEWKGIVRGASAFNSNEIQLVEARDLFSFEKVGTAANGNMQIRVHNGSQMRLEHLTIGAKAAGRFVGAVYVDVSEIGPGETKVLEHDCYKTMAAAARVELFRTPRPEPEDRGFYREFGMPDWLKTARSKLNDDVGLP